MLKIGANFMKNHIDKQKDAELIDDHKAKSDIDIQY